MLLQREHGAKLSMRHTRWRICCCRCARITSLKGATDGVQVLDGGTFQGLNNGTSFTRAIKVPPLWKFYTQSDCPRAQYDYSTSSVGSTDPSQPLNGTAS